MIFWIVAGLMVLGVVLAMLWPLLATDEEQEDRPQYDLSVYRDQLAELSRDLETGRLSETEYRAARTEVERRMLAAGRAIEAASPATAEPVRVRRLRRLFIAVVTTFVLPAGALAVYLGIGDPNQPDLPLAGRDDVRAAQTAAHNAPAAGGGQGSQAGQGSQGGQGGPMIAQLRERLAADPTDAQAWLMLGRSFMVIGRYDEAIDPLRKAVEHSGGEPGARAALGEALVLASGGQVTPEAELTFRAVYEAEPNEPRSRFYIGLAAYQQGLPADALKWWTELEADTPIGAPWEAMLAERIETAANESGADVASLREAALARRPDGKRPPAPEPVPRPGAPTAPPQVAQVPGGSGGQRGPTREDMAAAQQMTPQERQEMIRGMVEGLAARLEEEPNDLQGWLRLSRSYGVLGEPEKEKYALSRAAGLAPDDIELQMQYARALFPQGTPESDMPEAFKDVVRGILAKQPDHAEAMFFGGMVAAADGDNARAIELWRKLLDRMGAQAPARTMLENRIKELGG